MPYGFFSSLKNLLKHGPGALQNLAATSAGIARGRTWDFPPDTMGAAGAPESGAANPLRKFFDARQTGRGIWKWIHYFDIYHRHFQKFVGQEVHLIEVGIFSGGSLDMWKDYFGPQCHVYGVDIEPACKAYEDARTHVFIGDQGSRDFWREFKKQVPRVDILVDDGGHKAHQQIATLEEILPHLRPGGVYLCEDVVGLHNRFAAYVAGLADNLNDMSHKNAEILAVDSNGMQRMIHSIHTYPFVTVIEKHLAPVAELSAPRHGTEWQPFL